MHIDQIEQLPVAPDQPEPFGDIVFTQVSTLLSVTCPDLVAQLALNLPSGNQDLIGMEFLIDSMLLLQLFDLIDCSLVINLNSPRICLHFGILQHLLGRTNRRLPKS